jgi:prepilin-type N-terminal cleavage/methylation domain-containing protein
LKLKITKIKSKAFTLIEMLVTLGIVTALSTMVLVYSRKSETVSNLIREGDHMAFELRRVQNQAMLVLQQDFGGDEKVCGWGIYIDQAHIPQDKFLLFADLCLQNQSEGNGKYDDGEESESISLLNGIEISESNISSILFIPPEPQVKFDPDIGSDSAYIKIQLKNHLETYYEIQVSEAGQISKQLPGA